MRQRDLEILLQRVPGHPNPDPRLEQVPTPAPIAAHLLFTAAALGDIEGLRVLDLGCGTGVLATGAALLGASEARGYDVDEESIRVAREAARALDAASEFHAAEVREVDWPADTVVQNPPFGAQRRGADRPFLDRALALAPVVYTLHLERTRGFVERFAADRGATATHAWCYDFPVPHLFRHHQRAEQRFPVVALRLQREDAHTLTE